MTPDEIQNLKALIVGSSLYFGHEIPDEVLQLYIEDLEDLPFEKLAEAIRIVRRDPKTTRFPLPAVLREVVQPGSNQEDEARESISRIVAAVSRYGWCNGDRAKEFIGPLGWFIVERQGGWLKVCELLKEQNLTQFQAQWRELAITTLKRAKAGTLPDAPAIPNYGQTAAALGFQVRALPKPTEENK